MVFRVLVTGVATQEVVTGLFIDYGTSSEIPITELRWLRKVFLSLPAQALSVRLWGIKEEEGHEHEARKSFKKLSDDGNMDWLNSLSQLSEFRSDGERH